MIGLKDSLLAIILFRVCHHVPVLIDAREY